MKKKTVTFKVGICKKGKDPVVDIDNLHQKGRNLQNMHQRLRKLNKLRLNYCKMQF